MIQPVTKFFRLLLTLLCAALPSHTLAFGGGDILGPVRPVGTFPASCYFSAFMSASSENIALEFFGDEFAAVGGSRFSGGFISDASPEVTAANLQSGCNFSSVTNIVQNGADGTFAEDGYIGIRFRAIADGETTAYDYEIALSGVTNTVPISTRTEVPNTPPTADAGADLSVEGDGRSIYLDGTGSSANDPGQTLTYTWNQISGLPGVLLAGADTANPTVIPLDAVNAGDTLVFSLVVNDGIEDSVPDTVTITFFERPEADAGPDQTVESGDFVQLDGSGSTPGAPNPAIVQYIWTRTGGPVVALTGADTVAPTFTAPVIPPGGSAETIAFTLVVFDGQRYSAQSGVRITVNPSTDVIAPTVEIFGTPATYEPGQDFTANISFSEPVIDFEASDITVTNGTVTGLTGSGDSYVATITPSGATGYIEISIGAGVATDPSLNPNEASAFATLGPETIRPTVVISGLPANYERSQVFTADITFSEPVIDFERGDITVANGTAVGLTGSGANYVATILPLGAAGDIEISVAAGVATDPSLNPNLASAVATVGPEAISPTVVISGTPANYEPGQDFAADITFSEPVIGFEAGDITVVNGTVAGLTGAGDSYVATIAPSGVAGDIEISVAAGVATDPSLNPNEASAVVVIGPDTSGLTSEFIADAMIARGKALILAQPNLRQFFGSGSSGGFRADITRGVGNILFSAGNNARIWTHGSANWSNDGDLASSYANIALGAHIWKGENLILGAMAEYDRSASEFGGDDFVGTGWLAGPYVVAQLPNQPLVFSASYLMGRTDNEVTLDGLPTERFSSDRRLLTLGAEGRYGFGNDLTLIPSLDFYHLTDRQGVFRDSNGFDVPAQTVRISEANIGLGFEKPVSLANGDLTLLGEITGVYHKIDALTQDETSLHGRLSAGLNYTFANGSRLSLRSHYDGLGQSGYEAYGADLLFELTF